MKKTLFILILVSVLTICLDGQYKQSSAEIEVVSDMREIMGGAIYVAAGDHHSCAITQIRSVKCWGFNGDGRLGIGRISEPQLPTNVVELYSIKSLAIGYKHTCALTTWGGG